MNKMQMAHEMALAIQGTKLLHDMELVSEMAWKYADAMQAEADKREDKTRPEVLEEWQPDWSQAPEWAEWWAMDGFSNKANWYKTEPFLDDDADEDSDEWNIVLNSSDTYKEASSFGYQGNWKDSLRKRPEAPHPEVDWRLAPNDAIGWMVFDGVSTWLGTDGFLIEDAPSFGFTGTHIVERPQ